MPCWHTCESGCSRGSDCHVPAGLDGLLADALAQKLIGIVEVVEKIGKEGVAIRDDSLLDSLEDTGVHALWIVRRLQQEGRDRRDEYRLADTLRSVLPYVARDFAS